MTKELFSNVLTLLNTILPPRGSEPLTVVAIAPIWEQLLKDATRNEESVETLLLLSFVLLMYFEQGELKKIREILEHLDAKEIGTGVRVKIVPGPPA